MPVTVAGKKIWFISVDHDENKDEKCLEEGVVTFDINIHLLEELGGEIQDFSSSFRQHQKDEFLKNIYQDFDREFRAEMAKEFRELGKSLNPREGFQKVARLNRKVVDFTSKIKDMDAVMKDFDELERQERFKKIIVDRLMEVEGAKLVNWYNDVMRFMNEIQVGDMIIMPLKEPGTYAIGKVKSDYEYIRISPAIKHIRRAKWKRRHISSERLEQKIPSSQSVFRLEGELEDLVLMLIRDQWFLGRAE